MPATSPKQETKSTPKAPRTAVCQWCGEKFTTTHHAKEFCTTEHKQEFANWCASRGKVLFPIAMAWRTARGRKGIGAEAMAEMVKFLDQCAAELANQGAPSMAAHFKTRRQVDYTIPWLDRPQHRPQRQRLAQSAQAEG